jgi:hypothetical protein
MNWARRTIETEIVDRAKGSPIIRENSKRFPLLNRSMVDWDMLWEERRVVGAVVVRCDGGSKGFILKLEFFKLDSQETRCCKLARLSGNKRRRGVYGKQLAWLR